MLRTGFLKTATVAAAFAGAMAFGAAAQANSSTMSIGEFSATSIAAYTEAKASFAAGVAAELHSGPTSNKDMILLRSLGNAGNDYYFQSGKAFQDKHQLSPKEIRHFISVVAQELKSNSISARINQGQSFHRLGVTNGVELVSMSKALGLIESAGDSLGIKDRVAEQLREQIQAQPQAVRDVLEGIVASTRENAMELTRGNADFWQNVVIAMDLSHSNASFPPDGEDPALIDPFKDMVTPSLENDPELR